MKTIEITVDPQGPDHGRDAGLHRRRMPRGQPVRRAGPGPAHRREADRRVLPGPGRRPAAPAVPLIAFRCLPRRISIPSPNQQGDVHDARRAFVGVRARLLHRHLGPVVRARRRGRRDRPALPPAGLDAGHLGHRPRPVDRRPGRRLEYSRQRRRPAGRDQGPGSPGHARRHGAAGAAQLPPVPGSPEVVQALDTAISAGKQDRTFVVVLAPVVQIPVELERQFVVIEHDLPGRDQLRQIARAIATEPGELPDGEELDAVLDAAAGLTRDRGRERLQPVAGPPRPGRPGRALGAEGPDAQEERPADAAPGRRDVRRPGRPGGPQGVLQAFPDPQTGNPLSRPRGVLLLGVPGTARARSARRWATRSAGPRWSSTSGR